MYSRPAGSHLPEVSCHGNGSCRNSFSREQEQDIHYEGIHVGTRRADFVVEDQVIVELEALITLADVHHFNCSRYANKPANS